jgi:hypothetical protein
MSVMPPDSDNHTNGGEPELNMLAAFVDRRLDHAAHARVVEHLAECARCRAIVAELMDAGAGQQKQSRAISAALPIAATLLIAAGGGALYFALRGHVPVAPHPVAAPATAPAASGTSAPARLHHRRRQPARILRRRSDRRRRRRRHVEASPIAREPSARSR